VAQTAELADGGGELILVVDDEAAIVASVRLCLEGKGYRVLVARNGQEALNVFVAHQPQVAVVVTDVMMPVMDGLKLARALRGLDARVRVIASSGLDVADRAGEAEAGDIAEFLSKPYQSRTLLAAIRRQLDLANPATGAGPPG
jgi:CheY-like chemotaxis protein